MEFGSYNNLAQHRMCSFFFFFKITPPYRTWTIFLLYNFTTSSAHFSQLWYLTRHSFKSTALYINILFFSSFQLYSFFRQLLYYSGTLCFTFSLKKNYVEKNFFKNYFLVIGLYYYYKQISLERKRRQQLCLNDKLNWFVFVTKTNVQFKICTYVSQIVLYSVQCTQTHTEKQIVVLVQDLWNMSWGVSKTKI